MAIHDAIGALRFLEASGHDRPVLLAYTPVVRTNPFQRLLYRAALDHGVGPVPLAEIAGLAGLAPLAARGVPTVGHLHWTNPVLRNVVTRREADAAIDAALAALDSFRGAGGRLVWTIHNVQPHDTRHEDAEIRLGRGIAERADRVHVMARGTIDAVGDRFTVRPDQVLAIPHPTYAGAYPDAGSLAQARFELGIDPDERVAAFVGAIHPYKGLDTLRLTFDRLATEVATEGDRPRRLIVAGRPDGFGASRPFLDWAAAHPQVTLVDRTLTDLELATVVTASDVLVLPYERTLNSGVLLLSLTFGRPVAAAARGAALDIVDGAIGRLYDPDEPDGLARAWREAEALDPADVAAALAPVAAELHPDVISGRLMMAVLELVGITR